MHIFSYTEIVCAGIVAVDGQNMMNGILLENANITKTLFISLSNSWQQSNNPHSMQFLAIKKEYFMSECLLSRMYLNPLL